MNREINVITGKEIQYPLNAEQLAAQEAYIAGADDREAESVRTERDFKLALTDFHALTDTDMTEEMTTYRQALRDVPQQDEFPNSITWPTEPN